MQASMSSWRSIRAKHMNWLHCFGELGLCWALCSSVFTLGGWRSGYFNISLVQFALVLTLLAALGKWTEMEHSKSRQHSATKEGTKKHSLLAPLKSKGAPLAMLTFFFYTSVEASVMLWGASYLVNTKFMAPETAAGWACSFWAHRRAHAQRICLNEAQQRNLIA